MIVSILVYIIITLIIAYLVIEFFLFNSGDEWRKVLVLKGTHFPIRKPVMVKDYSIKYVMKFTESCVYDHGNNDQYDQNKLIGLKEGINPFDVTMMVSWRWNLENENFELFPYQHDSKLYPNNPKNRKFFMDKKNMTTVSVDEEFSVEIINHLHNWEVLINKKVVCFTEKSSTDKDVMWLILHWFGGTTAAPHTIKILYREAS